LRPAAQEQLDVVGQIVSLIKMPANQKDRPAQLHLHSRDDGRRAATPESGNTDCRRRPQQLR